MLHRLPNSAQTSLAALVATVLLALALASGASAKTIDVASPRDGATLSRTATFTPRLTKNLKKRTSRVEVWVDSKRLAVDSRAPFRPRIDTTKLADGAHTFSIRAVVRNRGKARASRSSRAIRSNIYSRAVSAVVSNASRTGTGKGKGGKTGANTGTTWTAPQPDPTVAAITNGSAGWKRVFTDEFEGSSLDTSKWATQRDDWIKGAFPYNNLEGAMYKPENDTVENGALKQTIRKMPSQSSIYGINYDYSTGMVNTNKRFTFTYGYVEARMKVPSCSGCWPAFWMLPAKDGWPPEIDIYEFFDSANDKIPYFSSHWKVPNADQEYTSNIYGNPSANYTEDWHTYGMLWTPTSVQVFIDGLPGPTYTGSAVPHEDMYLIIQAAIGRNYNTPDGANLQTDWVHVYQQQ